jgi:glutamate/tyrosine decarboxylase-like PLP-dependent enzyme
MATIRELEVMEALSRSLEPGPAEREQLISQVAAYAESFLRGLDRAPGFVSGDDGAALLDSPIAEEGTELGEALQLLRDNVDKPGINTASGKMLGFIPGGGLYHAALGDFLAAVGNRYSGHFFGGPGAVRMENMLVRWMADIIGYPETSAGSLLSGGSIAHLTAIVCARDSRGIQSNNSAEFVVYLTEHSHYSVSKALHIAGLGNSVVRNIPVDGHYHMNTLALARAIDNDKKAGLKPWLVVGSAGTTDTGSVDPLVDIGEIADRNGLWFHVDGAYGAFFTLSEEGKDILKGMEKSDSIIIDPHKTLFLPHGTGAVLLRDWRQLHKSFRWQSYVVQDASKRADELSPMDLSPELTRHFRGLRMWLPLKVLGVAPFRAALTEKIKLARYFHEQIQKIDGFEVGPVPDLSIVVFRFVPTRGDPDVFNRRLLEAILEDGRIFASSTRVDGNLVLRLAVVSFRTHLDDIEETLEVLEQLSRGLTD